MDYEDDEVLFEIQHNAWLREGMPLNQCLFSVLFCVDLHACLLFTYFPVVYLLVALHLLFFCFHSWKSALFALTEDQVFCLSHAAIFVRVMVGVHD